MRLPTARLLFLFTFALLTFAGAAGAVEINELRVDQPSTDTDEYFELKGTPLESLAGYTYLVIGDATSTRCGTVESVTDLSTYSIQSDGFLSVCDNSAGPTLTYDVYLGGSNPLNFENSDNVTHLLVTGWSGTLNMDLDTNDDGTLDVTPWTAIVDGVALTNGATVDCVGGVEYTYYPSATLGPDGTFHPGHVYRCADTGAWTIGPFNFDANKHDTPGGPNRNCLTPPPTFVRETRTPCVPFVGQTATAVARVLYATGANIGYKVNGGLETVAAMSLTGTSGDTSTFEYVIPAQLNNSDLVEYTVKAYNANPDTTIGYAQGYFVGTVDIGSLYPVDGNGRTLYRYYGARVQGNVTAPYGLFQTANTEYYVQDSTGGISIFKFGTHTVQPQLGDDITVEGVVEQYNGKLEISTSSTCDTLLVDINGPGSVPAARLATTCDPGESLEGWFLTMHILKFVAAVDTLRANTDYLVTNCYADTLILRIDGDTNIPGTPATSQYVTVQGIGMQFDTTVPYTGRYQLVPRYVTDIQFLGATDVKERELQVARLLQNAPNPFRGMTEIRYQVPGAARAGELVPVKLDVFDLAGRHVTTLVNEAQAAGEHSVRLTREAMKDAGNGIYFYRLEVAGQVLARRLVMID